MQCRFRLSPLLLLVTLGACSPGNKEDPRCTTGAECPAGQVCIDGRCQVGTDGGGTDSTVPDSSFPDVPERALLSIAIEPATADLTSVDGSMPEQAFMVVGTYSDGSTGPVLGPTFSIDTLALGNIDEASGRFVANGIVGGAAVVTATALGAGGDLTATADLTVTLNRTITGDGVPADPASLFAGAPVDDPARGAGLVYPLDGAVMPQNVYPADVQWLNGAMGDVFRVTLAKPHATVTAYLLHTGAGFGNHWLVDVDGWRSVAQTDPDDDATITVDRNEAASREVISSPAVHVRFARAALTGSVYYWDIARGRIVRIDDGTATRVEFMPNPPLAMRGESCVGCHSVSPSGRYMAGRLGGGENVGAVFDLTVDLTGDPPPTLWPLDLVEPTSLRWWFASWSPDETRMVVSADEGNGTTRGVMRIYDPMAGTQVSVTGSLPDHATHPSWSPDGMHIAYVSQVDNWGGTNTAGNISIIDVTGPDTFGPPRIIHMGTDLAGSTPPGNADAYPTWSPDSELMAFAHGSGSRSETQQSALYSLDPSGGSPAVRLDAATGGSATDSFQPRFSPFQQGGYYWLSFLSRRDYGNADVGTRGRAFQQIWVAAIRTDSPAGADPSEVAYWLPGQNTASRNISAYWAPRPCRPDGEACSVSSECCGGDCRPGMDGSLVCSPPPPERCRERDETCTTSADCCEGLTCIGRVCVPPIG